MLYLFFGSRRYVPKSDTPVLQSHLLSAVGWLARHERRHLTAGQLQNPAIYTLRRNALYV